MPKERATRRARAETPKGNERKEKENDKRERKVVTRATARAKTRKEKVWGTVTPVGSQDILLETVGETICCK